MLVLFPIKFPQPFQCCLLIRHSLHLFSYILQTHRGERWGGTKGPPPGPRKRNNPPPPPPPPAPRKAKTPMRPSPPPPPLRSPPLPPPTFSLSEREYFIIFSLA